MAVLLKEPMGLCQHIDWVRAMIQDVPQGDKVEVAFWKMYVSDIAQESVNLQAILRVVNAPRIQVHAYRLPPTFLGHLQEKSITAAHIKQSARPFRERVKEASELVASPPPHSFFQFQATPSGSVSPTDVSHCRAGVAIHKTTPGASDHPSVQPLKQRIGLVATAEGAALTLRRTESLNTDPEFLKGLAEEVVQATASVSP